MLSDGWRDRRQPSPEGSELIYQAEIHFRGEVEYGVSMAELFGGGSGLLSEGARFDQTFEGQLHGPRLAGSIDGTDYLYVRPDGAFLLHLHARVETEDGANIAMASEGVSLQVEGEDLAQLRTAVSLFTLAEPYRWLNKLQLWAVGTLDPKTGTAFIEAYAP